MAWVPPLEGGVSGKTQHGHTHTGLRHSQARAQVSRSITFTIVILDFFKRCIYLFDRVTEGEAEGVCYLPSAG